MNEQKPAEQPAEQPAAPDEKSGVPMRQQAHGGALQSGNPGGKGGGRPPSEIRDHFRRVLDKSAAVIEALAAGESLGTHVQTFKCTACEHKNTITIPRFPEIKDVLKAVETAGKFGLGKADGADIPFVKRLALPVQYEILNLPGGEEALKRINEVWTAVLKEYGTEL